MMDPVGGLPAFDPGEQERMDGSPRHVADVGLSIDWQLGPVKIVGVNGTTMERVLEALRNRLEGFQRGPFACKSNAEAKAAIEDAIAWLDWRTGIRQGEGVEGQNLAHQEDVSVAPQGVVPRLDEHGIRRPPFASEAPKTESDLAGIKADQRIRDAPAKLVNSHGFVVRAEKNKLHREEAELLDAMTHSLPAVAEPGQPGGKTEGDDMPPPEKPGDQAAPDRPAE